MTTEWNGPFLSIGQAAIYVGVSRDTVRRWAETGRVQAHRTVGGHRRYSVPELDRIIAISTPRSAPLEPLVYSAREIIKAGQRS